MSTSIPGRIRNGARAAFSSPISSSWARSRSADSPLATVSRGEWSVSAIHSCPRSRAASAISSGGLPPSDQSECAWQSPRIAARSADGGAGGPPPSSRVRYSGSWPAAACAITCGGYLADPGQLPQRPGPHPAGQLPRAQPGDHLGGAPERPHPVRRRAGPLKLERDLPQRPRRIHACQLTDQRRRPTVPDRRRTLSGSSRPAFLPGREAPLLGLRAGAGHPGARRHAVAASPAGEVPVLRRDACPAPVVDGAPACGGRRRRPSGARGTTVNMRGRWQRTSLSPPSAGQARFLPAASTRASAASASSTRKSKCICMEEDGSGQTGGW